jgi:hypothetical protein
MAKINYPQTDAEKAKLYLHAMMEIKLRLFHVSAVLNSTDTIPLFKNEICYLHFRHICELISIACLAGQGDYQTHRAFREEYSPPKIFKALAKQFENFFPEPCTMTTTPKDGVNHHHLEANSVPGAYSEADVTKLWNEAGTHLHRASVNKYLSTTFKPEPALDKLGKHLNGLVKLLGGHVVPIKSEPPHKLLLQVQLEDGEGAVEARFLRINVETSTVTVEAYKSSLA